MTPPTWEKRTANGWKDGKGDAGLVRVAISYQLVQMLSGSSGAAWLPIPSDARPLPLLGIHLWFATSWSFSLGFDCKPCKKPNACLAAPWEGARVVRELRRGGPEDTKLYHSILRHPKVYTPWDTPEVYSHKTVTCLRETKIHHNPKTVCLVHRPSPA
uniref:Uncharacterized protein n=1 Tax=Eutreptiella gymnastica TaxID=73025 RepID=A0A7S1NIN9_9EUGL